MIQVNRPVIVVVSSDDSNEESDIFLTDPEDKFESSPDSSEPDGGRLRRAIYKIDDIFSLSRNQVRSNCPDKSSSSDSSKEVGFGDQKK